MTSFDESTNQVIGWEIFLETIRTCRWLFDDVCHFLQVADIVIDDWRDFNVFYYYKTIVSQRYVKKSEIRVIKKMPILALNWQTFFP